MTRIFSSALSERESAVVFRASLLALMVTAAFFIFESGARNLLMDQLPEVTLPGTGKLITAAALVVLFATAVFGQLMAPYFYARPFFQEILK